MATPKSPRSIGSLRSPEISRSPSANSDQQQQQPLRSSKAPHKWILFVCWLLTLTHIWFSADGDGGNEFTDDPTFDAPRREMRKYNRKHDVEAGAGDDEETPNPLLTSEMDAGGEEEEEASEESETDIEDDAPIIETKTETKPKLTLQIRAPINKTALPNAVHPITFRKCCVPGMLKDSNKPKDIDCFGTCYDETACNDKIYPFNSAEERDMFPRARVTKEYKKVLDKACKSPKQMTPPVEWCQNPYVDSQSRKPAYLVDGIPPAGCVQSTNGGGSGAFQHVLIFPSAKLAFCGIPKVGITQWEQFLRFFIGAKDYPSLPHYKLDREALQFDKLDPVAQRRIWEDDDWTWAAFIRNPAERLLSAYLDKVKSKKDRLRWIEGELTFEKFTDLLSDQSNFTHCGQNKGGMAGLGWCSDPHWRPQVYSCGISERLDRFDFIGDLHSAAEHTHELLEHVGLWESHGKHYINGGRKIGWNPWCNIASHPANHTAHLGFNQKDEVKNATTLDAVYGHSKGSKSKIEKYFTPTLLKRVEQELYADDHKLWKLVNANGNKLSRGKDLMAQISSKCAKNGADSKNDASTIDSNEEEVLHEALQPITYKDCCIPAMSTSSPKDVPCFGTCYNEKACNDPIYPFTSADEKTMFPRAKITSEVKQQLRKECKSPKQLIPPVEWCQKPYVEQNSSVAHLVENIPPAGCSSVGAGGGSGAFQHVLIFPSAKLAFCGIPKVGITQWEQFLRFHIGAKDYPSWPHAKMDRTPFQYDLLDPSAQRRIWEDEEWTWAAFIRDPAERLLSAYLDKVMPKSRFKWIKQELTFKNFTDFLSVPKNFTSCDEEGAMGSIKGLNWCSDPHWRPQVYSCGLSERLDRFKFIGDLDNASDQTKELLEHVGLWESHGKHFIHGGETAKGIVEKAHICNMIPHPFNETSHSGFQQKKHSDDSAASNTGYSHSKGSKSKFEKFYTPELLTKVQEELYADDYKLWKLVSGNGGRLSRGKDLMAKLSSKCTNVHDMNMLLSG